MKARIFLAELFRDIVNGVTVTSGSTNTVGAGEEVGEGVGN